MLVNCERVTIQLRHTESPICKEGESKSLTRLISYILQELPVPTLKGRIESISFEDGYSRKLSTEPTGNGSVAKELTVRWYRDHSLAADRTKRPARPLASSARKPLSGLTCNLISKRFVLNANTKTPCSLKFVL